MGALTAGNTSFADEDRFVLVEEAWGFQFLSTKAWEILDPDLDEAKELLERLGGWVKTDADGREFSTAPAWRPSPNGTYWRCGGLYLQRVWTVRTADKLRPSVFPDRPSAVRAANRLARGGRI